MKQLTRGCAAWAALAFLLCACTPFQPDPPTTRSLAAAADAIQRADHAQYLQHTGKGDDLLDHARKLAATHDPQAWLLALGCLDREHDLDAARAAMRDGDRQALLNALGLSEQLVAADILQAGHSVRLRRSDGRDHYVDGTPPLAVLERLPAPPAPPPGLTAWHISATLAGPDRDIRVRVGMDGAGVTDLRVGTDLTGPSRRTARRAGSDPAELLDGTLKGVAGGWFEVPDLHWIRIRALMDNGDTHEAELRRDGAQTWGVLAESHQTQPQRLEAARDLNLQQLHHRVSRRMRDQGRYPESLDAEGWNLPDPAAPNAELGWADTGGFELARNGGLRVQTLHRYEQGRRAITMGGRLHWQD